MMSKKILFTILIVTSVSLTIQAYLYVKRPQYAYINVKETFEKFDMKIELESKFKESKTIRDRVLDSLLTDLQLLSSKVESSKKDDHSLHELFEVNRENYIKKKEELEIDNINLTEQYNKQIITQMRQYINEYCSDNNYEMVFGEDNSGSVLYSVTDKNITPEIIDFINKKYSGI